MNKSLGLNVSHRQQNHHSREKKAAQSQDLAGSTRKRSRNSATLKEDIPVFRARLVRSTMERLLSNILKSWMLRLRPVGLQNQPCSGLVDSLLAQLQRNCVSHDLDDRQRIRIEHQETDMGGVAKRATKSTGRESGSRCSIREGAQGRIFSQSLETEENYS